MNKLLLIDINNRWSDNLTPLHIACNLGHHAIVERLLDSRNNFQYSVDVNVIGENYIDKTALQSACSRDFPLTLRKLLEHPRIDVNDVDEFGRMSLLHACGGNRKAIVMELLKHPNIQITAKDINGRIPLHKACMNIMEDADIIRMLIGHQKQKQRIEQLNATDNNLQTPLNIACLYDNAIAVVEILNHAAVVDINETNSYGQTPIHTACTKYLINDQTRVIIQALLSQPSVMIHKKNNDDETSFDIIKKRVDQHHSFKSDKRYWIEICQLLEDYPVRQRWLKYCYLINFVSFSQES